MILASAVNVYILSVGTFAGLTVALAGLLILAERFLINYGVCKLDINAGEKPLEVKGGLSAAQRAAVLPLLHDRMTCFMVSRVTFFIFRHHH